MTRAAPTAATGVRRKLSRAGARAALIQSLVIVAAFTIAGVLTRISTDRLQTAAMKERVLGEARSLDEEFAQRGADHLPHTLDKRTRLWRGFGYRLESAAGAPLAGALAKVPLGWTERRGEPGAVDHAARPYLVFTEPLPDGSLLSVGQDLSAQIAQSAALGWVLLLCGGAGVGVCVTASYLLSRGAWRRVEAVATVARSVQDGRLDARVAVAAQTPRDDLDDLAITFNAMLGRIDALVSQVRQVSTDIAHDMRTPLTRVRQRMERLRETAAGAPDMVAGLQRVEDDLDEILRTFQALLQLAEIGSIRSGVGSEFDLGDAAACVADAFRPDIEESGRRFEVGCDAAAAVRGDRQLVSQAVANLLENALRHTPPRSTISLRVLAEPHPTVVVQDNGAGIPTERRQAVLQPLVRLERSRNQPGSGLGLSIVAAVCAHHAARLDLGDADPGLRVSIAFPPASTT